MNATAPHDTMTRLEAVTHARDLDALSQQLLELRRWVGSDLDDVERELREAERADTPTQLAARHLICLGGKRLRPLCVALAARVGTGFHRAARDLAVAAELVHSATLLHDDVVDLGDRRRGAPTSRVLYGNVASIYAGDWLLVEAMQRIRRADDLTLLDRALHVLHEMLEAETLQLMARGSLASRETYLRVVDGKTASLFRWSMFAGGRAGGLDLAACEALERFGGHLGVAFQVMDDVLDVSGDPALVGKSMFADVREGKSTYPLILAAERDAEFSAWMSRLLARDEVLLDDASAARVAHAVRETGAIESCVAFARERSQAAVACLEAVPAGRARDALERVAVALLHRRK